MKRFGMPAVVFGCLIAVPAQAESWMVHAVDGLPPFQTVGAIDRDAIDRSSPQRPVVRTAVVYETALEGGTYQIIQLYAIDCTAQTSQLIHLELRGQDGAFIDQAPMDVPTGAIAVGSPLDAYRMAACEDRWDRLFAPPAGQSLSAIAATAFKL